MLFGAVLVGLALALLLYNRWDSNRAGAASDTVLTSLTDDLPNTDLNPYVPMDGREMTIVEIDGYGYIGYLSIPSINLNLPVMAQWSYEGLKIAPGRFSGTVYGDSLVICGHNYARHFSPIKWLAIGTEVNFTDMDNREWHYEVIAVETLQPTQVEEMSEKNEKDDWDLTLFTCNTGGQTRCAVRCARVE